MSEFLNHNPWVIYSIGLAIIVVVQFFRELKQRGLYIQAIEPEKSKNKFDIVQSLIEFSNNIEANTGKRLVGIAVPSGLKYLFLERTSMLSVNTDKLPLIDACFICGIKIGFVDPISNRSE